MKNKPELHTFRMITIPDEKPEVEKMIFALNEKGKLFTSYLSNLSHKDKPVKFLAIDHFILSTKTYYDFKKDQIYKLPLPKEDFLQVKVVMTHEEILESEIDCTKENSKVSYSHQILLPDIQKILDYRGIFNLEMDKIKLETNKEDSDPISLGYNYKYVPHLVEGRYIIHLNK